MCANMIWNRLEIKLQLYYRKMYCLVVQFLKTCAGGDKNASEEECVRACKLACADEFIQKMPEKYNTFIEQGGTNVSGGQKQRLCIARALLKNHAF